MRVLRRSIVVLSCFLALGVGASAAYTVQPGDTLSGVARRLGVSARDLVTANGITDPNHLVAGRRLTVPGEPRPSGSGTASASPVRSHVVAAGEHLTGIAARYGVTVRQLADTNQLADRHLVRIGMRLRVPGSAGSAGSGGSAGWAGYPARLRADPARLALVPIFVRWSAANGLDPALLMATTWLESGWQNHVVSSVGAVGIGQLMPDTITFVRRDLIGVPSLDAGRPEDNIRMSARFMQWLLVRTKGDLRTALAGYYQGLRSVHTIGPYPSTVRYVDDVLALRRAFAGAIGGRSGNG